MNLHPSQFLSEQQIEIAIAFLSKIRYNEISDVTIARQHKLLPVIVVLNGAEMEDSHENTRLKDEIHRNIWRGR